MDILCKLYEEILPLREWLQHLPNININNEEYKKCFEDLNNIWIGFSSDRQHCTDLSLSQNSHQHEIVLQAVQKIIEMNSVGNNVLAFGFSKITHDPSALTWQNIESRYPNSSVKLLQSRPWRVLLELIGDKIMLYMLEYLSLFIEVKPTCFVQLTGVPLHELWSFEKKDVLQIDRKPPQRLKNRNKKIRDTVETFRKTKSRRKTKTKRNSEPCVTFKRMKKLEDLSGMGYDNLIERSKAFTKLKQMNMVEASHEASSGVKLKANTEYHNGKCETKKRRLEDAEMPPVKRGKFSNNSTSDETEIMSMNKNSIRIYPEHTNTRREVTCRDSGENVRNISFKPYDSTLILPRKLLLYNINVRERIPKSARIMKFEQSGVLALYNSIFIETSDFVNTSMTLTPPSPTDVEAIMNNRTADDLPSTVTVTTPDQTVDVGSDWKVIPLLKDFLHNLRTCPYKALLNHYCPVNLSPNNRRSGRQTCTQGFYRRIKPHISTSRILNNHVHKRKVYLFLRACLLHILTDCLIGGRKNRNILLKKLYLLLSLGKYDKISLGQIMVGLKTKTVDWLQSISSTSCRLYLLSRLVHWLFINVIWVVLRTMFYITDTAFLNYKLLYYRQVVWNRIKVNGLKDLLKRNTIQPIVYKSKLETLFQTAATLGLSTLRFLPKQNSLRPIINMGVTLPDFSAKKISINKQLTDLHQVLSYFKKRNPNILGYGKLGTDEVRQSWRQFTQRWKDLAQPQLYFVKTDITRCYDSIIQKKLYEIMEEVFDEEMGDEDYISMRYVTVLPRRGMVKRQFDRMVFPLVEFDPDIEIQSKRLLKQNSSNTILIDKMNHHFQNRSELLKILHSHIHVNIIKIGSKYYQLTEGISQGSVLSTLLCSFYYADMERKYFNVTDSEFVTRIVDDYLFVTPYLEKAEHFLKQMMAGIPEYNCFSNTEKVLVNFHSKSVKSSQHNSEWFPWCGMMFNTRTLEVAMDYQRYMGACIADTMTFDLTRHPGTAMKEKLVYIARQKCRRVYVDREINSEDQVVKNLFDLFVFSTLKFHVFVKKLPLKHKTGISLALLEDLIKELSRCIQNELKSWEDNSNDDIFGVEVHLVVKWLCRHAFIIKFKQHRAQYNTLLKSLQNSQTRLEKNMAKEKVKQLMSVCGAEIPEVFKKMLN